MIKTRDPVLLDKDGWMDDQDSNEIKHMIL